VNTTILILIGLGGGLISGLLGIGGATLMIPALIYFVGYSQKLAQGTTLALMIPPIGFLAAYQYFKKGYVDIGAAAIMALAFFIGGYAGSKLALDLTPGLLRRIFAIFLMIV